jgi:hypothetical protein
LEFIAGFILLQIEMKELISALVTKKQQVDIPTGTTYRTNTYKEKLRVKDKPV